MAIQRCMCFILLIAAAQEALSNPLTLDATVPPIQAVEDKGVNTAFAVNSDGGPISCQSHTDCTTSVLGPESHCSGTHCKCNVGTDQYGGDQKCLPEINRLGDTCERNEQCTKKLGDNVHCKDNYCICTPESAVVNNKCWKQQPLSGHCQQNEECIGSDTVCLQNTCQCNSKTVPHPDNTRCLPVATSFNDPCEETIQCSDQFGDGARCHEKTCQCASGYHFDNNACMKDLILDEICENLDIDAHCFLVDSYGKDRVVCNKVCQCREQFVPSKDKTKCLEKGEIDDGTGGGATSISAFFATLVTVMLARLVAS